MRSISFAFLVGRSTVSLILAETCKAIWGVMENLVFPEFSLDFWKTAAKGFSEQWNFPNCVGAIDGKHVTVQVI